MHDPLLLASATDLAASIRRGDTSSVEAVEAHIRWVERVNPTLNAVVEDCFDRAREEARAADALLLEAGTEDLPPFHGVPCTIKECFAVEGMQRTAGLVSRVGDRPSEEATAVRRLREAGAIALGTTNVSELCMWLESNNRVYGRCNNPYDPRRIVGGSSGGEGAIVGAGASPFGLGADVGGSIRMPAFFNGVFGHKSSGGLVPATGQWPIAHGEALRYLTTGPICRRAGDLEPLLRVLAGPDGQDSGCEVIELGDPGAVDLSKLRILDVPDNGRTRVSPELRQAQQRVVQHFRQLGARIEQPSFPLLSQSYNIWSSMLSSSGGPSFAELMGDGGRFRPLRSLARWGVGRGPHTLPAIVLAALEFTADFPRGRAPRWVQAGAELRAQLDDALGDDGILLFPSYPRTAPRHHAPLLRPFRWVYTAILNVMQLPSTQIPLGLSPSGLPLGVQAAAGWGQDHLGLAVALELERAFGGWQPPPTWGDLGSPKAVGP